MDSGNNSGKEKGSEDREPAASGPAQAGTRASTARGGMDLTQGPILKVLLIFSLPVILQYSVQPLFGFMDRLFIAQINAEAFAAVANASLLQMLAIMMAAGLANGVTSYVSRLVGKGDYAEADNATNHAMILMLVFSVLIIAVFVPLDKAFFALLNVEERLVPRAHQYIMVILLGNITIMFFLVGSNILRGEGNSRTPLVIALISVSANIVADPLLIFSREDSVFGLHIGWLGLDVAGAALATVASRGLACILLIGYLMTGRSVWTFSRKNWSFQPRHFIEILRVGAPMLLVNLIHWINNMVFFRILNKDPDAVVAYGMGVQLNMLGVLPMIGMMMAVVGMVGQNFGAGRIGRAARTAFTGGMLAAAFSGTMGAVFMVFPEFFVSLFNKGGDPHIQQMGVDFIYIVAPTYALVAQVFVLGAVFQGMGKGMPPLIITVVRFVAVSMPLVLILTRFMGPTGAWVAVAASHAAGGITAAVWVWLEFRRRRKR